jgi:hypothetical protein
MESAARRLSPAGRSVGPGLDKYLDFKYLVIKTTIKVNAKRLGVRK